MMSLRKAMLVALLVGLAGSVAMAGGEASLFFGQKELDGDFDPVDSQSEIGVVTSWDFDWPVALAVDILQSSDDDTVVDSGYNYDIDVDSMELNVGVRKFWGAKIRPYAGGGLAWVELDGQLIVSGLAARGGIPLPFTVLDDKDSDIGYYANVGVAFRLGRHFQVAVDVRYSDATAEIEVNDPFGGPSPGMMKFDSGGTHYGALLGAHW